MKVRVINVKPARPAAAARAFNETVTIPTFPISKGLPSPAIFDLEETRGAYPKTMFDVSTRPPKPVDRHYQMCVAESDLMRVEVLPEVGGRVWRIIEKRTGRNLLWTNDAVKPVDVGRRRGWLSGGIEWPFPVSNHGEDTMDPYRGLVRENADGSATVTVASFDHFYRFWGSYDLTVAPGEARVAITVRLYNPTPVRNRYQIWVNAAVPAGEDMQFIFPVDYIAGHGTTGVHPWPMWDGGKYDRSFWRNQEEQLGVFGWGADFFGAYYHNGDYGTVRYCPRTKAQGIKAWTWGAASRWTTEYSVACGPNVEIQRGRWPTQDMYGWLEPHEMYTWTEYWYPVNGLGGVDEASECAAMSVNVEKADGAPRSADIRICAASAVTGTLAVSSAGRTLLSKEVRADAGQLIRETVDLKGVRAEDRLAVSLVDADRRTVISYDKPFTKKVGPPPEEPKSVTVEGTGPAWQAFESALSSELLKGNLARAREEYEAITANHAGFAPAWKALGILSYKQLDYDAAQKALARSVKLDPRDAEARYYLGLVELALGRANALKTLRSIKGGRFMHLARFAIGIETLKGGRPTAALKTLREAAGGLDNDPVVWDCIAVAARLAGDAEAAADAVARAVAVEPLDPFAAVEKFLASGKVTEDAVQGAVGADEDLYIEAALFYDGLGESRWALVIAEAGRARATSALYRYQLAYLASRAGNKARAKKHIAEAGRMGTDYVFPHRGEDRAVLAAAAAGGRNAGLARYHEGTLLYWLGRSKEALDLWVDLLGKYEVPGLYRKVADALSKGRVAGALESAIDMYSKALADNPRDIEVYYALDDLYEKSGDFRNRREILSRGRELFAEDDELALRMARYQSWRTWDDEAARILETHNFHRTHQSRGLMALAQRTIETTYSNLAMKALRGGIAQPGDRQKALEYLARASRAAEILKEWFD